MCANLCSAVVDARPPKGSDRIDPVDDFRVIGDKNASVPTTTIGLDGVITGLVPLLPVPLDDVPGMLLSVSC